MSPLAGCANSPAIEHSITPSTTCPACDWSCAWPWALREEISSTKSPSLSPAPAPAPAAARSRRCTATRRSRTRATPPRES